MRLDYAKHTTAIARAASKLAELCAQGKHDEIISAATLIQSHAIALEMWAVLRKGDE